MRDLLGLSADAAIRVALSGLWQRQAAIAGNIANVDTPGYKQAFVTFEEKLAQALGQGPSKAPLPLTASHAGHLASEDASEAEVRPEVGSVVNTALSPNGNNVDIDVEMLKLAETTIRYNALAQLMAQRLSLLRTAATEGQR